MVIFFLCQMMCSSCYVLTTFLPSFSLWIHIRLVHWQQTGKWDTNHFFNISIDISHRHVVLSTFISSLLVRAASHLTCEFHYTLRQGHTNGIKSMHTIWSVCVWKQKTSTLVFGNISAVQWIKGLVWVLLSMVTFPISSIRITQSGEDLISIVTYTWNTGIYHLGPVDVRLTCDDIKCTKISHWA